MNQLRKKVDLSVFIEGQQYISYIFGSLGLTRRDHIGFGFNQARVSDTGCKNWKSQGIFLESQKIRNSKTSERHCRKNQKNPGSRKKVKTLRKNRRKKKARTYISNWFAPRWNDHVIFIRRIVIRSLILQITRYFFWKSVAGTSEGLLRFNKKWIMIK